jgi:hypothetical protein
VLSTQYATFAPSSREYKDVLPAVDLADLADVDGVQYEYKADGPVCCMAGQLRRGYIYEDVPARYQVADEPLKRILLEDLQFDLL